MFNKKTFQSWNNTNFNSDICTVTLIVSENIINHTLYSKYFPFHLSTTNTTTDMPTKTPPLLNTYKLIPEDISA